MPDDCFRLSTQVYWKAGDESEDTKAGIAYFALCSQGSTEWIDPVESYHDTSSAFKAGTYDLEMRPNITGNGFEGFWLKGIEFTEPGKEYIVSMNLNGAIINFKGATWYSLFPAGFKEYLVKNDMLEDFPVEYHVGGGEGDDREVALPSGPFDIRIHKDGDDPLWIENYAPELGKINIINYDEL